VDKVVDTDRPAECSRDQLRGNGIALISAEYEHAGLLGQPLDFAVIVGHLYLAALEPLSSVDDEAVVAALAGGDGDHKRHGHRQIKMLPISFLARNVAVDYIREIGQVNLFHGADDAQELLDLFARQERRVELGPGAVAGKSDGRLAVRELFANAGVAKYGTALRRRVGRLLRSPFFRALASRVEHAFFLPHCGRDPQLR
jgi:hypothetical protein